ncbi:MULTISPECIES: M23 family metallopeptidase [unclassified Streptococcus]|uniref:M23 family metallopeptidase n=1 Tax=unclassified Streptococcus TaxID=2608887 RepID=UPI00211AD611|nr:MULTISPECIES: M23 family metallopeptidase [unclassified Streptococcus]MCQ9212411.1 phage tail tip lysozyme [Streptococcus sp. B01]MCQ9213749.1 phage tail tip lysozyme [Streptococcus sp. O1]MCQ9214490.1 phage tail tip lysozyme [Streptococcus sp. O1]
MKLIKNKFLWLFVTLGGSVFLFFMILVSLLAGGSNGSGNDCEHDGKIGEGSVSSQATVQGTVASFATEEQLTIAKKIVSVAVEYGLDENKAYGAVGNGEQESSLIPPFIELNHLWNYWANAKNTQEAVQEIQKHGSKAEDLFMNGWNSVLSAYGGGLDESGYRGGSPDGSHWVGFGVWQWTGYNGVKPYFDWADANNRTKADIDSILVFAFSDSSQFFKPYTAEGDFYFKRLEKIKNMPTASSPAEGATIWLDNYEYAGSAPRGGWVHLEQRQQYATNWAVRLGKEKLDQEYAKSILSAANTASAQQNSLKNDSSCNASSESSAKGGHPYAEDYYLTAAFQKYSQNKGIADVNTGNQWHNGIDLVGSWEEGLTVERKKNKGIHSVLDGTIVGVSPAFGQLFVKSDKSITGLDDDIVLEYTHLEVDSVYNKWKIGDTVKAGEQIANEGDTGSSGLWHLHFGVLNADVYASGADLWRKLNSVASSYGSTSSSKIIDPGIVLEGIEVGWLDSQSSKYLGDEFLQPTPLKIRVDGKTAEDERIRAKK